MLISFSVRNYKTFKERAEWSMVASADKLYEDSHVVELPKFKLRLLKSAVLYGANASGKTKLVDAMAFMQDFVRSSFTQNKQDEPTGTEPFQLSTETVSQPSEFEMLFYYEQDLFRYGFAATPGRVVSEWLYRRTTTKEHEVFYRDEAGVKFGKAAGAAIAGVVREIGVRENILVLSLAAQLNHAPAKAVQTWFTKKLVILSGLDSGQYWQFTLSQLEEPGRRKSILHLLHAAGFDIEDASFEKPDIQQVKIPQDMTKELRERIVGQMMDARTEHRRYDAQQLPVGTASFSLRRDESAGTQKFFALTGPLLATLANAQVMVVDELDARLHPTLVCDIVHLFNSSELNPRGAQLLFNTHDTNLLSAGLFRRDQIWFAEKDHYGAATLYSLADFKTNKVRKGDNFERNYIEGRYGAIPYLGNFAALPTALLLADEHAG